MIEDESGRIELSGNRIFREGFVTGCVVGLLGSETTGGQFDVVDICLPEMPPQPKVDEKMGTTSLKMIAEADDDMPNYIAFASGLDISGDLHESLETHLMMEYLTGELLCPEVPLNPKYSLIWLGSKTNIPNISPHPRRKLPRKTQTSRPPPHHQKIPRQKEIRLRCKYLHRLPDPRTRLPPGDPLHHSPRLHHAWLA
jgi:DNA polymerase delta subunit OB-fold domain